MKTMRNLTLVAMLALGLTATAIYAADEPAGGASDKAATTKPAAEDKAPSAWGATPSTKPADDLADLLDNLTPQQIEELVKQAVKARLKVERQQVAAEIKQGLLYDPDEVDAAAAILEDKPADTQADNIVRILKALAKVDAKFAKAYKPYSEGKYEDAATAAKAVLNLQQSTYLSAAKCYIYADSLAKSGKTYEAIDAFGDLMVNMPDRISFAATAAFTSADLYEQKSRMYYAMQMYGYCVKNYGLTLDQAALEKIVDRMEKLLEMYKDPMTTVAGKMGEVKDRLTKTDSGKDTQAKQQEIVMLLEDMIKTAEEQSKSGGGEGKGKGDKKGDGEGEGQAKGDGKGDGKNGQKPGSPNGNPSSPAKVSALVPGAVARPTNHGTIRPTTGGDDWSNLPPREREKLEQTMRKVISDLYRDQLKDYRTRLSTEPKNP